MKKSVLGQTGIEVTELCFGALPMGPLQKNLPVEEAAELVAYALENGINFVDTAQAYKTYEPIKRAIEITGIRPVIASKSYETTYEAMEAAIHEALTSLGVDYIDIFHIHAPKNGPEVFEQRKEALKCLVDYKNKGIIKAVGISTHNVRVAEAAADVSEIDVVFPIINKAGRGIIGGSAEDMQRAITLCADKGKGIYLMKVLGGGTLAEEYKNSMEFARAVEGSSSIALGMTNKEELMYNLRYFNGDSTLGDNTLIIKKKKLVIAKVVCIGCGKCIEVCHSDAVSLDENGKASIDTSKCIQCGYCISSCPSFSIRMA
jgi:aryl-alcohol dehydrogenase-like predicted oxidoreductase/ferredoxin